MFNWKNTIGGFNRLKNKFKEVEYLSIELNALVNRALDASYLKLDNLFHMERECPSYIIIMLS